MNERLMDPRLRLLNGLREAHEPSGLSYREVAQDLRYRPQGHALHSQQKRQSRAGGPSGKLFILECCRVWIHRSIAS